MFTIRHKLLFVVFLAKMATPSAYAQEEDLLVKYRNTIYGLDACIQKIVQGSIGGIENLSFLKKIEGAYGTALYHPESPVMEEVYKECEAYLTDHEADKKLTLEDYHTAMRETFSFEYNGTTFEQKLNHYVHPVLKCKYYNTSTSASLFVGFGVGWINGKCHLEDSSLAFTFIAPNVSLLYGIGAGVTVNVGLESYFTLSLDGLQVHDSFYLFRKLFYPLYKHSTDSFGLGLGGLFASNWHFSIASFIQNKQYSYPSFYQVHKNYGLIDTFFNHPSNKAAPLR